MSKGKGITTIINYPITIIGGGPVGIILSKLLSQYKVPHCLVEKKLVPTSHPQAHFINIRSMEIIKAHFPFDFKKILEQTPNLKNWRDFVYCHSLIDNNSHFARLDHFDTIEARKVNFWQLSPTNVTHLSQNKFENIIRKDHDNKNQNKVATLYLGHETFKLVQTKEKCQIYIKNPIKSNDSFIIESPFIIGADGSNSFIRSQTNIVMEGVESMQSLINVHFQCKGSHKLLLPRSAMLYFIFNEEMVGVLISHDIAKDEWVCQIPYFPPYQSLKDFDHEKIKKLLRFSLFGKKDSSDYEINIFSINSWTMQAQVAKEYTNKYNNIFLVGDSAHRFPPAGGFGMNTGIQDAHNLAWKLALVYHKISNKKLLLSYETERKPIAQQNTKLSLKNYEKSALVARTLGVDPFLANLLISSSVSSFNPLKFILSFDIQKTIINNIFKTGLYQLKLLNNWESNILGRTRVTQLRKIINSGESLPLLFPEEDVLFNYTKNSNDNDNNKSEMIVGCRLPHCWFEFNYSNKLISSIEIPAVIAKIEKVITGMNVRYNSFFIISISENLTSNGLTHSQLQLQHQLPCYNVQDNMDNNNSYDTNNVFDLLQYSNELKNETYVEVSDISGRWFEILNNNSNNNNNNNLVVVVRPDCHINQIIRYDNYNQLKEVLINISEEFCINNKIL